MLRSESPRLAVAGTDGDVPCSRAVLSLPLLWLCFERSVRVPPGGGGGEGQSPWWPDHLAVIGRLLLSQTVEPWAAVSTPAAPTSESGL